jgi:hypothetical protein
MAYQYADKTKLIADLLPASAGKSQEVESIGRVLDGVSNFIDRFCKRPDKYFMPVAEGATPELRYFTGEGYRFLRLPPYVYDEGDGLGATVSDIDSNLYYRNAASGWLYAKPYPSGSTPSSPFAFSTAGFARGAIYEVSAIWGFKETPPAIIEAARELTVRAWETQRGIFGQVDPSDGTVIERAMPPFVEAILLEFRRREFEIS